MRRMPARLWIGSTPPTNDQRTGCRADLHWKKGRICEIFFERSVCKIAGWVSNIRRNCKSWDPKRSNKRCALASLATCTPKAKKSCTFGKMVTPTQWWLPREHLQETSVHRHVVKTDASEKAWKQCKTVELCQVKTVKLTFWQVQSSIHRLYHQDGAKYLAMTPVRRNNGNLQNSEPAEKGPQEAAEMVERASILWYFVEVVECQTRGNLTNDDKYVTDAYMVTHNEAQRNQESQTCQSFAPGFVRQLDAKVKAVWHLIGPTDNDVATIWNLRIWRLKNRSWGKSEVIASQVEILDRCSSLARPGILCMLGAR